MERIEIFRETIRHFLGPVRELLDDASVSEVMINGFDSIWFEREGRLNKHAGKFESAETLMAAARNVAEFVNRSVGGNVHSTEARLPDGSRVHIVVPPASRSGVCIAIRKFQKSSFRMKSLIERGTLTAKSAEFLGMCVLLHKNVIISGGTGSGKTSFLNAMSAAVPATERIIVIEDTSELQLAQPHTLYFEAQKAGPDGKGEVTIRDLFVDSLRMRPDRIIVGEVRRGEALDLIQSMISGHAGSLATVHANTPRDAATRLETLCMMSDVGLPVYVARAQVASAVHVIVQIGRLSDGSRRVQSITECLGLDDATGYRMREIFRFQAQGLDENGRIRGEVVTTGEIPGFSAEPYDFGLERHIHVTGDLFRPRGGAVPPQGLGQTGMSAPPPAVKPAPLIAPPPPKPPAAPPKRDG